MLARLRALGLKRIARLRLTRNRNVMVSFSGEAMRMHEGFLEAPDPVLRAVVTFVQGRTRAERAAARRVIVAFPVPRRGNDDTPTRRETQHPDDAPLAERLLGWHTELNQRHFAGSLREVTIRVSRRMKRRLGHYSPGRNGGLAEIAISRRHIRRHGWAEAVQTLLHEMVHQWQDESGVGLDHGRGFRAKAREVGIEASAARRMAG